MPRTKREIANDKWSAANPYPEDYFSTIENAPTWLVIGIGIAYVVAIGSLLSAVLQS